MKKQPSRLRKALGWLVLVTALAIIGFQSFRPSRTEIVDLKLGQGPAVKSGDRVVVHYVGTLADGRVFDDSKAKGRPFEFEVGRGVVIKGWDVGLVGMRVGGVRRLVIPPEEAYGAKGRPPEVPPDSRLRFEIDLIKVD